MKKLLIALGVLLGLGAFWYLYEVRGAEGRRTREAEAKKVLRGFKPEMVARVDLQDQARPALTARRQGGAWSLEDASRVATLGAWKADASQVDLVLANARDMERQEVILEKAAPADLAGYGLDKPLGSASFTDVSGGVRTLLFGIPSPAGNGVYCLVSGTGQVMLVPQYNQQGILKGSDVLRDKAVWNLDTAKITRMRSDYKSASFDVAKGKDGQWTLRKGGKTLRARADKVMALAGEFAGFKVHDFVDDAPKSLAPYGLAPAREHLEVWVEGQASPMTLLAGTEKDNFIRFQVKGRPLVFTMEKYHFNIMEGAVKDLEDKSVFQVKPFEVAKIAVKGRGLEYTAEKKAGDWVRTPAAASGTAKADWEGFLGKLAGAQSQGPAPKALGDPEAVVTLSGADGKTVETATFYKLDPAKGARAAKGTALNLSGMVPEDVFQSIPR